MTFIIRGSTSHLRCKVHYLVNYDSKTSNRWMNIVSKCTVCTAYVTTKPHKDQIQNSTRIVPPVWLWSTTDRPNDKFHLYRHATQRITISEKVTYTVVGWPRTNDDYGKILLLVAMLEPCYRGTAGSAWIDDHQQDATHDDTPNNNRASSPHANEETQDDG